MALSRSAHFCKGLKKFDKFKNLRTGAECTADSVCTPEERCVNSRCVPACQAGACGLGAECHAVGHQPSCSCVPPLQGDARIACSLGKLQTYRQTNKYLYNKRLVCKIYFFSKSL